MLAVKSELNQLMPLCAILLRDLCALAFSAELWPSAECRPPCGAQTV